MRHIVIALLILMASFSSAVAVAPQGHSASPIDAARSEIERILAADNLDSSRLGPREIADIIADIERGDAPQDFWDAYQAHVRAWQRLADVADAFMRQQMQSVYIFGEEELEAAEREVSSTFDTVEQIARRYGAQMPVPPVDVLPTI